MKSEAVWEQINGHTQAVSYLKELVRNGALSHAYLFVGPAGVGKFGVALVLAAALNCEHPNLFGCGECPSCVKMSRQVHPDLLCTEPQGNVITIDQIREVQRTAGLKPREGRIKVYIVDQVEKLNPAAANALLKALEEPPPQVLFVLIAENLEGVLQTIISRCQLVRFSPIAEADLERYLVTNHGVDAAQGRLVARITSGVHGKSIEWVHFPERFLKRERVLKILQDLPDSDLFKVLGDAEDLVSDVKQSIERVVARQKADLAEEQSKGLPGVLRKELEVRHRREVFREERKSFQEILSTVRSWYRDLLLLSQTGETTHLVNIDKISQLKDVLKRLRYAEIRKAIKIVENSEDLLKLNVNKPLIMERLLLRVKECH